MSEKLSKIFGLMKTTYAAPSVNSSTGTFEQDVLFIEIVDVKSSIRQGKATARVEGCLVVFSQVDKLPFGYFNKKIQQADPELTRKFLFFNIDSNPSNITSPNPTSSMTRFQNIMARRVSFFYLYSDQYDPDQGELTSLEL